MTVTPKPSATVVVARDTSDGMQVLLVKRRAGDDFGETYTFPGGVLDADESKARVHCAGLGSDAANALLGLDDGALDYFSAVVRELFEETGILLGTDRTVDPALRTQLHDGTISWTDLLQTLNVRIPCDALHYFTHWVTPSALPKRWSTRFFLAAMPVGQEVVPDGSEITDFCWLTPAGALTDADGQGRKLPYPTRKTLRFFQTVTTVAALVDWAVQRQAKGIATIQPEIRAEDGKRRIFMPDIEH